MLDASHIRMAPISLDEMDSVKLLNRIDTKYLTTEDTLVKVLEDAAAAGYRALVTEGSQIAEYDSFYFDTPELKTFFDHRDKRLTRQKIRTREYVASRQAFLEIKRKNNHGRTKKKRTGIAPELLPDFRSDAAACAYLESHSMFSAAQLSPSLETIFHRITLVNPAMTERLTIDTGVRFRNLRTGREASLKGGVVIELKQDGRARSEMKSILLKHRVKPVKVSKYCIGITLTNPDSRPGRFKEKVRLIEKQIKDKLL